MANERTEKATPKRQNELRSKGQISKSPDFNSAVMLSVGLYLIYLFAPSIMDKLKFIAVDVFARLDPARISEKNIMSFFDPYISELITILFPFFITLMVIGCALQYFQVGSLFTLEPLKPNFGKLSPMSIIGGFKKFFNLKSFVELIKSFIKMGIVGGISYSVINERKMEVLALQGAELSKVLLLISNILFQMMTQIFIVLIIVGFLDKKYQKYEHEKSIKMTKEEVKDERKNTEGDPQVKAKVKGIQMQFAMQRMMSSVPKADVILTNPTHYAVALRYDTSIAPTPQVIAKGVDYVAFKIKEIAENNNVPIVENKPLARTLYKIVPLDGLIPADLYVAVAEVLAYVYKTNKRKR